MSASPGLRWLVNHVEEILAGAIVIGLAGLAFVNVVARYLVNYALAFSEELEVAGLVWLTMLGAAAGFRRGVHLGFSFLRDRLPPHARKAGAAFGVAVTVGVGGVLVWGGLAQIRAERALSTVSEALAIPQWIYTAAVPVGAALMIVRVLQVARREIDQA
jgi:TRAP-type C4-dicarboxylate transport system permease small subunit